MALVLPRGSQAFGEAKLTVDAAQQERPTVG
jgi:hypothetical protein